MKSPEFALVVASLSSGLSLLGQRFETQAVSSAATAY
jgi:hypothetical protein